MATLVPNELLAWLVMMTTTIGSASPVPSTGWPQISQTGFPLVLTPFLSARETWFLQVPRSRSGGRA